MNWVFLVECAFCHQGQHAAKASFGWTMYVVKELNGSCVTVHMGVGAKAVAVTGNFRDNMQMLFI